MDINLANQRWLYQSESYLRIITCQMYERYLPFYGSVLLALGMHHTTITE